MTFDLRTVGPPAVELASILWAWVVLAFAGGLVWTTVTLLGRRATAEDRLWWGRAFVAGVVLSVLVLVTSAGEIAISHYLILFILWVVASTNAAGLFLTAFGKAVGRRIGRGIVQGLGMGGLGLVTAPLLAAIWRSVHG